MDSANHLPKEAYVILPSASAIPTDPVKTSLVGAKRNVTEEGRERVDGGSGTVIENVAGASEIVMPRTSIVQTATEKESARVSETVRGPGETDLSLPTPAITPGPKTDVPSAAAPTRTMIETAPMGCPLRRPSQRKTLILSSVRRGTASVFFVRSSVVRWPSQAGAETAGRNAWWAAAASTTSMRMNWSTRAVG